MVPSVRTMRSIAPAMCKLLLLFLCLLLAACATVAAADGDDVYYEDTPEILVFTTTARIHPDMPEFTFHRIVGDYLPEPEWWNDREVSIIIEDEHDNIIQEISDLVQVATWGDFGDDAYQIILTDYNFDGYLDMHLIHRRCPGNARFVDRYFWLWDASQGQFVRNEQLSRIASVNEFYANQETRQIGVWHRLWVVHHIGFLYEYHDGKFVRVSSVEQWGGSFFLELTRTNYITGEVTIELHPFQEDIPAENPPDEIFMKRVEINPDMPPLIVRLDAWEVDDTNELKHRIDITIWYEYGTLIQQIEGLEVFEGLGQTDTPFNLHFADYNQDGYLDMGLWRSRGGTMRNMPHFYWLWDTDQGKFVMNDFLTDLSWGGTVQLWEDGTVRSFTRGSSQHYGWTTFAYQGEGSFAPINSLVHEWIYDWVEGTLTLLHLKITEIDHISGIETITIEQMKS